ncbi:ATP-binding protein [Carnobacterium pleistocenium]|uniref:ATP-binding protein n=1 Tax=Carnobacterium pleistocenium TaxID=181073 RepID=UPI0005519765|nr:ATP-binding protein [Carnobacterium pleistocenium]
MNLQEMMKPIMERTKTTYLSEHCKVEGHEKYELMELRNGEIICPKCEVEKKNKQIELDNQGIFQKRENKIKHRVFLEKSVVGDMTLLNAGFKNYITKTDEEQSNKQIMIDVVKRCQNNEVFNLFLMGQPGVGKSHLSMATLKNLNESEGKNKSCLYVSEVAMLRKIRASFSDNQSKYTEDYFINLLGKVEYLVLDDIGSSVGAVGTTKRASDFSHRVLYSVMDQRQDKSTIFTTNLSWKELEEMYDGKLISRMSKNMKTVIFKKTVDKRMDGLKV